MKISNDEVLKAVKEASISIACLFDDCDFIKINTDEVKHCILGIDLEHIQDQLTIIENYFDPQELNT